MPNRALNLPLPYICIILAAHKFLQSHSILILANFKRMEITVIVEFLSRIAHTIATIDKTVANSRYPLQIPLNPWLIRVAQLVTIKGMSQFGEIKIRPFCLPFA